MESESVKRERRMESARGHVHLTSDRASVHTQQCRFLFFLCIPNLWGEGGGGGGCWWTLYLRDGSTQTIVCAATLR